MFRSVKDPSDSPSCKYRHDKISEDCVIRRAHNEHIQNENKYVNKVCVVIKIKYCYLMLENIWGFGESRNMRARSSETGHLLRTGANGT